MNAKVFVSYSRHDRQIVTPLVQLLRLRGDYVFFDLDSITPGQLWRDELETAIASASWFVLFWCEHSSHSSEVEREFRAALSLGKKIVPLLLDDTLIPERVSRFQGIDFRSIPGLHPKTCQITASDPFAPFAPPTAVPASGAASKTAPPAPTNTPRLPDDFDPFADLAPPVTQAPHTDHKAGPAGTPRPIRSLDDLFGLGSSVATAKSVEDSSLSAAADALLAFLRREPD